MQIDPAESRHVSSAALLLARAFESDPIIRFFFGPTGDVVGSASTFFSILLRARIALGMPALVALEEGEVLGAAMGYPPEHPDWPAELESEWEGLEAAVEGLTLRFEVYESISKLHHPEAPHFYLGVLGVKPEAQGRGVGSKLLAAFRDLSISDPTSTGVYLETANPDSRRLYERYGYAVLGEGSLGEAPLWCMFQPH